MAYIPSDHLPVITDIMHAVRTAPASSRVPAMRYVAKRLLEIPTLISRFEQADRFETWHPAEDMMPEDTELLEAVKKALASEAADAHYVEAEMAVQEALREVSKAGPGAQPQRTR